MGGILAATTAALLASAVTAFADAAESARAEEIVLGPLPERSLLLAADGSRLAISLSEENRAVVPLAEVPQVVVDTVLAVEDEGLLAPRRSEPAGHHEGAGHQCLGRRRLQGGSTVTQQLVKNALLTSEQDIGRKAEQAVLALRLEKQMTKEQLLAAT